MAQMVGLYKLVILAALCVSVFALKSPKTKPTGGSSTSKVPQSLPTGARCGMPAIAAKQGRIVGGDEATPHSWPWQVLLQCSFVAGGRSLNDSCGGSIIADKWIVTAAHCLMMTPDTRRDCKVLLGKHDLRLKESTQLIANIADYFVHPEYDRKDSYTTRDLGLIKLAKPVKFTDAIQPICLPSGLPELPTNKSCYATGWGRTQYDRPVAADRLLKLTMVIAPESRCYNPKPGVICATGWDGVGDVCGGDSGGPLACREDDQRWYLRGALSRGPAKCKSFAVFTKVAALDKWIKEIIARN